MRAEPFAEWMLGDERRQFTHEFHVLPSSSSAPIRPSTAARRRSSSRAISARLRRLGDEPPEPVGIEAARLDAQRTADRAGLDQLTPEQLRQL